MMLGIDAAFFYFSLSSFYTGFGWVHMGYHDIDPGAHCRILPQQHATSGSIVILMNMRKNQGGGNRMEID